MTDDDDDALRKFGREVLTLLSLYRRAQHSLDRSALRDFNLQFVLVEALAQVAALKVVRAEPEGGK